MTILSPLTNKPNVELVGRYAPSITSDSRPTPGAADNYLCLDTGLLFNAAGTRGNETGFYQDEYVLHAESVEAEFVHFDGGKAVGLYDNILDFITNGIKLGTSGRVLDIGCGKGLLLNRFKRHHDAWKLHAIEPSKNATGFFAKVMPELNVFEGPFESSPFASEQFDFVMANGVLEHVPQPAEFLGRFAACMTDDGYGFIGVPNFQTNPADLITFDHLSKLTPNVTRDLFRGAGLKVVAEAVPTSRVPMWFIVQKDANAKNAKPFVNIEEERAIAIAARRYIDQSFEACDAAAKAARADGTRLGMFGTGTVGFCAKDHSSLKLEEVYAAFEDNSSLWGQKRLGVSIRSSADLATENIGHLVISANPCYYGSILKRIDEVTKGKGPKVYLARGVQGNEG